MALIDDLCKRVQALMDARAPLESTLADIVKYVFPSGPRFDRGQWLGPTSNFFASGSKSAERSPYIYDTTSVWAIDRLSSGMYSLFIPDSEKWHSLGIDDALAPRATLEEKIWFDFYRDHLFDVRYDFRSGFALANQKAIRSMCALGTGVYMTEESFGVDGAEPRKVPVTYRYIPFNECYIIVDYRGKPVGLARVYEMTNAQALNFFKAKTPNDIKNDANDAKKADEKHVYCHFVCERGDYSPRHNMAYCSYHFVHDKKLMVSGDHGYQEFPYTVFYWNQDENSAYGESPVMNAIAEIKSLNLMGKHIQRATMQWTDPPTMSTTDGIVNQPDLNPGRNNPGYLDDETFKPKIQPLITAQNPSFADAIMAAKRAQLKDALYVTLWQVLIENREMTATEALIRAQEKGEMIGPAGTSVQSGLGHTFNREHGIISRKGAFNPGSVLAPPDTLRSKSFGPKFKGPFDRARRSPELLGIERVVTTTTALAQIDPTAAMRLDTKRIQDHAQEISGAPADIFKSDEDYQNSVDQFNQQQQMAAQAQIAKTGGEAASKIIPAAQQAGVPVDQLGPALQQVAQTQQPGQG
jgi:hypothetical protein